VQIASLKCGGQGLNLTCANRVILVDPWWNSALEHQAYGRVFRMGQKKETWFVRLLTRKTIDGRMARLQAKKLKEINAAIKDFDSTRVQLNFEEVAELFGRVRRDENGRMIEVESDYDTDDEEEAEDGAGSSQIEPFGDLDNVLGAGASGQADMGNQGGIAQPGDFTFGDSVFAGYGIQDLI
jgi:superfamily II DNA or RNA helicase